MAPTIHLGHEVKIGDAVDIPLSLFEQHAWVQTLAKAYEERPVTLFRLIYALRDRKIQSFADAFKLRKD